jgi:8-oxo-dGTP pyrophosphatase MutT (NUDIX family)
MMPSENNTSDVVKRKVQVIVFTRLPEVQVLILRRPPALGHIWQPITGNVDDSDPSLLEAARRELMEETGIVSPVNMVDTELDFQFRHGTVRFVERVIAAETGGAVPVVLSSEHVDYAWLSPATALERLRWEINKQGLRHVIDGVSGERSTP